MIFGLAVFNERGQGVLNSEDTPFRFVTAAEPFDVVPTSGRYRFRKNITGRYSSSSMICVEVPEAIRSLWGPASSRGHYRVARSEEHTSELQSRGHIVCRLPREVT